MKKKGYSLIQVIIIMIVVSIVSGVTTGLIYSKSTKNIYANLSTDENVIEFIQVYEELTSDYFESVDKKAVINSAITGMTNYLNEKYTSFLDSSQADNLIDSLSGVYHGIGIKISDNKVIEVFENTPASEAGIIIGDEIISVNNKTINSDNSYEISEIISSSSEVTINIKRDNKVIPLKIKTSDVKINNTESKILDNSIGYLKINVFSKGISEDCEDALNNFDKSNISSLIIDLRDNTGGYLDEAYKTASLFLPYGKTIYFLEDKNGTVEYKDDDNNSKIYPIVLLINGSTASASEILASALIDSYGAKSVGNKTYGKGKVQHTYQLNNGSLVKYTSSVWNRPNGENVDNIGIIPDIIVDNKYILNEEETMIIKIIDNQLDEAIKLLSK